MAFDLDSMFFSFGNVHIISGPNGMCECGKDGKTCYEQLASVASKYMELNATSTNIRLLARDRAQIAGVVACGWCSSKNHNKVMDVELAEAIVDELLRQLQQA